ncbi:hypothetical protein [Pareuzebyella sediminis]|uniref:hypothetical protein n=1 Tax=Pareuzebyella sediminis TaxID=2607998 RepID=UPI0011F04875|nr:hypothetical protein [Pareuzebyella sediminis]
MKTSYLLIYLFLLQSFMVFGQTPERISYQATILKSDNSVLPETRVAMKIAILQHSFSGNSIYEEVHNPITSSTGIVSLEIGGGTPISGKFSEIDWAEGPYFIETLVKINGDDSFRLIGSSKLLSVPYALHSKTAERLVGDGDYVLKAMVFPLENSRDVSSADIGNIIECTADATLTLTSDFTDMKIGEMINIEAHNGAILNVETEGQVKLNYTPNGSATFESVPGNVRFGLIRKVDVNSYIISGQ